MEKLSTTSEILGLTSFKPYFDMRIEIFLVESWRKCKIFSFFHMVIKVNHISDFIFNIKVAGKLPNYRLERSNHKNIEHTVSTASYPVFFLRDIEIENTNINDIISQSIN